MSRPRVWLVPYLPGWSYDFTARALAVEIADRFEIRICYQDRLGDLDRWPADLVVDMWWRGNLSERFPGRTVRQVSSHRWGQAGRGGMSAQRLIHSYLKGDLATLVPSLRLRDLLAEKDVSRALTIVHAPKGFHPELLGDQDLRGGPLAIGWAGCSIGKDKRLSVLREAAPDLRAADRCLTQREMGDFYNAIDVIAIASEAEGDPRPLIEGMACGCFPITTDVGIVPELVRNGENGLIVTGTLESFEQAFAWCRKRLDFVRAAGRENARAMRETRTWRHVAPRWGDAFDAAIRRNRDAVIGGRSVNAC